MEEQKEGKKNLYGNLRKSVEALTGEINRMASKKSIQ
jgi:hypothetical protein